MKNEVYVLASRPQGRVSVDNFDLRSQDMVELAQGSVRVVPEYLSVDPYLRGRMNDVPSYVPPFQVGEPIFSAGIGRVIESRAQGLAVGALVTGSFSWSRMLDLPSEAVRAVVVREGTPASWYLGALGMTGLTAYVGMERIAKVSEGDTVFVSGAAGAVGSVAGQLAHARGARVIGSAGTPAKVALLAEMGFDAGFCYRGTSIRDALQSAAPEGIDVYFDNVGGEHLEAALLSARNFARFVLCGAISQYNAESFPDGPRGLESMVVTKRLSLNGFIVSDHLDNYRDFLTVAVGLAEKGALVVKETVLEGFEMLPNAFVGLFEGENVGKMLVHLASE